MHKILGESPQSYISVSLVDWPPYWVFKISLKYEGNCIPKLKESESLAILEVRVQSFSQMHCTVHLWVILFATYVSLDIK